MPVAALGSTAGDVRRSVDRESLGELMRALGQSELRGGSYHVYFVGGGTAVLMGWRSSTIDADLYSDRDEVFHDIQGIKERLDLNIEFARPEDFVPAIAGSDRRHVFIETVGKVSFHHYDPYAQAFSKLVRGFNRDIEDVRKFVESKMVDPKQLLSLVGKIPEASYAKYPALSRDGVLAAVKDTLAGLT